MQIMNKLDEVLYSRQLYVLGQNGMKKLGECDVLISGLGGLGVEIAKNLVLAGVRSITLHDEKIVETSDLSSQFFVSENDMGRNRAQVSKEKLTKLNKYVEVKSCSGPLIESLISRHGAVVLTDSLVEETSKIGDICHQNSIYFVSANVAGVLGQIFCDFGSSFAIEDKINATPSVSSIAHISRGKDEIFIHLQKDGKHSFAVNDFIKFEGVKLIEHINNIPPVCIKEIHDKYLISIENVDGLDGECGVGGIVKEIRMPETVHFRSHAESITSPNYSSHDVINENFLHLVFQVLDEFQVKKGCLPRPHSMEDANEVIGMFSRRANESNLEIKVDEPLLKKFAMASSGKICPMHSVIGSLSAHEIIKAITKRSEPINQWFYFSACEVLPPNFDELNEEDFSQKGSRHDAQIAMFGSKLNEKILNSKLFMVGVGAIGCEMLKNWAMMGVGSGGGGHVTITDMDMIEKSNLNRQFLFRPEHIGKMKSTTAAEMTRQMNAGIKIEAHGNKMSKESEDVYNDTFFESFDVIVNALDNIPARQYMADKSIYHHKPLLESGTEGIVCNVQVILSGLTCSYNGSNDPNEAIPLCTLKYFPTSIEHAIQWARDDFEGSFKLSIKKALDYMEDENFVENLKQDLSDIESLEKLKEVVEIFNGFFVDGSPLQNPDEICIRLARLKFEKHFNNQILQLKHIFPEDATTKEGLPFWCGEKKCPMSIPFERNNPLHMDYIISCANMFASALGFPAIEGKEDAAEMADYIVIPSFHPNSEVFIPSNDEEVEEHKAKSFDDKEFETLLERLPAKDLLDRCHLKMICIEFEKDDSSHIDFISSSSNMRALNYRISPIDKLEAQRIVGKIIPAIATTTSLVVGLACLELLKILIGQKDLHKFKNWYCQLGSANVFRYNVKPAQIFNYNDKTFTTWDYYQFEKDATLGEIKEKLKKENKVDVKGIFHGYSALVSECLTDENKLQERYSMKVNEAMEKIARIKLSPHQQSIRLTIDATDENGQEIDKLPFLKIKLL